jgi:hypothetical protein
VSLEKLSSKLAIRKCWAFNYFTIIFYCSRLTTPQRGETTWSVLFTPHSTHLRQSILSTYKRPIFGLTHCKILLQSYMIQFAQIRSLSHTFLVIRVLASLYEVLSLRQSATFMKSIELQEQRRNDSCMIWLVV